MSKPDATSSAKVPPPRQILFAPRGGGDFACFPSQFNALAASAGIAGATWLPSGHGKPRI